MNQNRHYPSKILLTGEYTVLLGHPAIAIPWSGRQAEWIDSGPVINVALQEFYHFIIDHPEFNLYFLLDEFNEFINRGGYLKSNIPFGYGLGSSGSFCAAVLDRFSNVDKDDSNLVFQILKEMESYFHGQSSGLDPLVSFYNTSIQICQGQISFPKIKTENTFSEKQIYLVDSKLKRDTQYLVSAFKESILDTGYLSKITNNLVPLNNAMIDALLKEDNSGFDECWMKLSIASLDIFHKMIPDSFKDFWNAGIESNSYYCKLCGAGGGGLFLVKVKDEKVFENKIEFYKLKKFI